MVKEWTTLGQHKSSWPEPAQSGGGTNCQKANELWSKSNSACQLCDKIGQCLPLSAKNKMSPGKVYVGRFWGEIHVPGQLFDNCWTISRQLPDNFGARRDRRGYSFRAPWRQNARQLSGNLIFSAKSGFTWDADIISIATCAALDEGGVARFHAVVVAVSGDLPHAVGPNARHRRLGVDCAAIFLKFART